MQAVVFPAPETVLVEQVPDPTCGRDEVIVQVAASGLCGTDLKMVDGRFQERGWPPSLPFVLGHEWTGTLSAVGPEVRRLAEGDRVVSESTAETLTRMLEAAVSDEGTAPEPT